MSKSVSLRCFRVDLGWGRRSGGEGQNETRRTFDVHKLTFSSFFPRFHPHLQSTSNHCRIGNRRRLTYRRRLRAPQPSLALSSESTSSLACEFLSSPSPASLRVSCLLLELDASLLTDGFDSNTKQALIYITRHRGKISDSLNAPGGNTDLKSRERVERLQGNMIAFCE